MLKILFGTAIVSVLSVAFSGFSIRFSNMSAYIAQMYKRAVPVVGAYHELREADNVLGALLSDMTGLVMPLRDELTVASVNAAKSIYVGAIDSVVGDKNFSIYDYVAIENESGINDGISGDITVLSGDGYDEGVLGVNVSDVVSGEALTGVLSDGAVAASAPKTLTPEMMINRLYKKKSTKYLLKHFYIVDSTTSVKKSYFNVDAMLSRDYSLKKSGEPQILIYHTHSASESYADNRSIVEVGDVLETILEQDYGYNVYHDRTRYDYVNGKIDRSLAYAKALPSIQAILSANPTIQVVIDLHRDGVSGKDKATTMIDGKETARVMFFNGLSRNKTGDIRYLRNDNLFDNLAFSLQMKLAMMKLYPDLSKPIYLKGYRYNLHLKPRCMLIELGNQNNTFDEACNAMGPFAKTLDTVLSGSS